MGNVFIFVGLFIGKASPAIRISFFLLFLFSFSCHTKAVYEKTQELPSFPAFFQPLDPSLKSSYFDYEAAAEIKNRS